jgi:mannose-6-phosphate isomerase-like protein (cupin superfamily)
MNKPNAFTAPGRRVVAGVNLSGKSVILNDGPVPNNATFSEAGTGSGGDLWIVKHVPANLTDQSDPLIGYNLKEWPSPGEVIARMVTWLPGYEHPMHHSDTIDILFVISGQVELILDEGSAILRQGDTVVQCGTNHGWRVIGDEPCTFAGVLIDSGPQNKA